jgi:molecular chaperone DnaK (HSP70)
MSTEDAGRAIGSALIDIKVQQHLVHRLNHIQNHLSASSAETAERMMLGQFERFKCAFGTAAMNLVPKLRLQVPGLQPGSDFPAAGIINSSIEISQDIVKPIFDDQVENMIDLIEEQLQEFQKVRPGEQISYLVLSGGLGSSPYVQSRLKNHFEAGQGSAIHNARRMRLIVAEEP